MNKSNKGITLIALIVTIIILLILAGIAVAMLTGENGILNQASKAGEETIKAQLKEEIEFAISEIQIEELPEGRTVTLETLKNKLPEKLEGLTAELGENEITGEYKDYEYHIDSNFKVTILDKNIGEKPIITYSLDTEEVGATQVMITVTANITNGTIVEIIKPDGTKEENTNTVSYTVNKSGKYVFQAKASNGRKASCTVTITNILPSKPIINSEEKSFPMLTASGVKGDVKTVSITFDDNVMLEHYYSEDNGTTWKVYQGGFETTADSIQAKSVKKGTNETLVQETKEIAMSPDALKNGAYDGDMSTYQEHNTSNSYYVNVSTDAIGLQIRLDWALYGSGWGTPYVAFLDQEKNELKKTGIESSPQYIEIPEGTACIKFFNAAVYEIGVFGKPLIPEMTDYIHESGGKASAKSMYASYHAWQAFDGNSNTYAFSAIGDSLNWWICYEFPEPILVQSVNFIFSTGTSSTSNRSVKFQGSNDNTVWVDLTEEIKDVNGKNILKTLNTSQKYKAYRLYTTAISGQPDLSGTNIFQLYGK